MNWFLSYVVTAFMSSAMIPNRAQAMEIWRFDKERIRGEHSLIL